MPFRIPKYLDECLYFTNRDDIIAWAYRQECPKCHKAKMGKPVVKGEVKLRAKEYQCPACKYIEDKATHEAGVQIQAVYTCPKCGKKGESTADYTRKNFQGIPSYVIECQHCGNKIALTKKMKRKKGEADVDD